MPRQLSTPNLTIFESALFRTTSCCIYTEDYLLLADPNWLPAEVAEIAAFAGLHGEGKELFLLFTHSDYDHIIGYGAFPGFTTIAAQRFVDNPEADAQLAQTVAWDDEYYVRRDYALSYPSIDLPVAGNGMTMNMGSDAYEFYQAPGHNYDGLITFNRSRGVLIVGDYLSNIEFPYVYHSFTDYRATLGELETLVNSGRVKTLITGHGDHANSVPEMRHRITESRAYLDELETAVRAGVDYDFGKIERRYEFPGVMRKFHEKNVALLKAELER